MHEFSREKPVPSVYPVDVINHLYCSNEQGVRTFLPVRNNVSYRLTIHSPWPHEHNKNESKVNVTLYISRPDSLSNAWLRSRSARGFFSLRTALNVTLLKLN